MLHLIFNLFHLRLVLAPVFILRSPDSLYKFFSSIKRDKIVTASRETSKKQKNMTTSRETFLKITKIKKNFILWKNKEHYWQIRTSPRSTTLSPGWTQRTFPFSRPPRPRATPAASSTSSISSDPKKAMNSNHSFLLCCKLVLGFYRFLSHVIFICVIFPYYQY